MKPNDREHKRRTQQALAEQGVEMTPDELDETLKEVFVKIRESLRAKGKTVPDDDTELFLMLKAIGF